MCVHDAISVNALMGQQETEYSLLLGDIVLTSPGAGRVGVQTPPGMVGIL